MRCKQCGAEIQESAYHCEYCGATIESNRLQNIEESSSSDFLFEQVFRSAEFQQRNSEERLEQLPKHRFYQVNHIFWISISCLLTLSLSISLLINFSCLVFILIGFFLLTSYILIQAIYEKYQFHNSPIERQVAKVVSKRTKISKSGKKKRIVTSYFITCQFQDGKRKEFSLFDDSLYGSLAEEDHGIAFSRSKYLLDFDRVLI